MASAAALVAHEPQVDAAPRLWCDGLVARALLADIAANPPRVRYHQVVYYLTREEPYHSYAGDDRVDALDELRRAAEQAVFDAAGVSGDMGPVRRFANQPTVTEAVDAALAAAGRVL